MAAGSPDGDTGGRAGTRPRSIGASRRRPAGRRSARSKRSGHPTRPATADPDVDGPLIRTDDLSGDNGLDMLERAGIMVKLDQTCGYLADTASTLYGRSSIAMTMLPSGAIAAGQLALWVWIGGAFPDRLDVISGSHYRASVHDRQLRVFNRKIGQDQQRRLGHLRITSPLRTACDIACSEDGDFIVNRLEPRLVMLIGMYRLSPRECLQTLWGNQRWPNHTMGVRRMMDLEARLEDGEERAGHERGTPREPDDVDGTEARRADPADTDDARW